jgi:hypothetical protein
MNYTGKCYLLLLVLVVSLSSCASRIMIPSVPVNSINNDKALVTFLPSKWVLVSLGPFGPQYNPSIEFDIWDNENFIGALSEKTYFQYAANPGEHLFIARGGNWSFVKANLQSGKRYYVVLTTYPLPFRGQIVDLQPVKTGDKKYLAEIQSSINALEPTSVIQEKYSDYTRKKINEVRQEIDVFRSTEYGFSILDAQDGI